MKITKKNNPIKIKKIENVRDTFYDMFFLNQFYSIKRIKIRKITPSFTMA